jgi:hypothetical protein
MALDWSSADEIRIDMASNIVINSVTGAVDGQRVMVKLRQTGSFSLSITAANVRYSDDIPKSSIVVSTVAGKVDRLAMTYDATDDKYDIIAFVKGFA